MVEGALDAGCEGAVIAGDLVASGAISVREQPPYGGPVAGLAAALPEVKTDWIMLLGCDLPHARLLCHLLAGSFRDVSGEVDGLVALHEGRLQWLAGIYRCSAIGSALERAGNPEGVSLRSVLGELKLREVQDPEGLSTDVDTPEELERLIRGKEYR